MDEPSRSILIRIEIQVPIVPGLEPPQVVASPAVTPVSHTPAPPASHAPATRALLVSTIHCPRSTAKVKTAYGGTSGVICAEGQGLLAPPYYTPPNVKVKIYTNVSEQPPQCPPDDAIDLGPADVNGFWGIAELGGVNCGPPGSGVPNRLMVWYEYPGVAPTSYESIVFSGECAETTDDCARHSVAHRAPACCEPTVIHPVWRLSVAGFAGKGMARFNGDWSLQLNVGDQRPFLWTSSSKRPRAPRIELHLAAPCGSQWTLEFRRGKRRVTYSLPAADWQPAGANIFTKVRTSGLPDDAAVPASVVVRPAA